MEAHHSSTGCASFLSTSYRTAEALDELVTKTNLEIKLSPILTDLAVLKWMMGVSLAGVLSLVLKAFF